MTVQKFTPAGFELAIYAETANINYFLNTPLTPATVDGVVNKQADVKTYSRRQYPGDPTPTTIPKTTRTYMFDPGRKVGNALPGSPFILDDGTEKRQFTFSGNVIDLHAFLLSDVKEETKLYTTGARYVIPKSS